MDITYLSNATIDSSKKLNTIESTYGIDSIKSKKELMILCIIIELLVYGEWYEFSVSDKQMLQETYSKLLRNNKDFVFDFPTNTIYSNINTLQTSSTFDLTFVYRLLR